MAYKLFASYFDVQSPELKLWAEMLAGPVRPVRLLGLEGTTRTLIPKGDGGTGGVYTPPTTGQIWPRGDAPVLMG